MSLTTDTAAVADLLIPSEAAARLGVSEKTLWRRVAANKIRPRRVLGRLVFVRGEVEALAADEAEDTHCALQGSSRADGCPAPAPGETAGTTAPR